MQLPQLSDVTVLPVILAGASGSRLSRRFRACAFFETVLRLPDGRSLFCAAFERAGVLKGAPGTLLFTNRDYAFQCQEEFTASGVG